MASMTQKEMPRKKRGQRAVQTFVAELLGVGGYCQLTILLDVGQGRNCMDAVVQKIWDWQTLGQGLLSQLWPHVAPPNSSWTANGNRVRGHRCARWKIEKMNLGSAQNREKREKGRREMERIWDSGRTRKVAPNSSVHCSDPGIQLSRSRWDRSGSVVESRHLGVQRHTECYRVEYGVVYRRRGYRHSPLNQQMSPPYRNDNRTTIDNATFS